MANYENLKVLHVFDKKKLELEEKYEDLFSKKQVTFIDAFRPGLRILLTVFLPVGSVLRSRRKAILSLWTIRCFLAS